MRVQVSTGNIGWSAMGFVTFMVGIFVAVDVFLESATGQALYFSGGLRVERLLIAGGATLGWLALIGIYRMTHQVRRPAPGAATQDLPDEPPALANMLANGFEPTREAVPATVLDLAARGEVDLEEVGADRFQVRLRPEAPGELLPFERRVLTLLVSKATDGVVPTEALTTGHDEQARGWWKAFRREVIEVAQYRGLSRDLWRGSILGVISVFGIGAGIVTWWAIGEWMAGLWYGFLVATVVGSLVQGRRQRDTPTGFARAAQILGFRRTLREGAFDHLPPTAVAVWERHLAYAAALGVAQRSLHAMPMGADDDHRAWSAMTGEWRLVRVRYPRWWPPGWGRMPSLALPLALLLGAASVAVAYALTRYLWPAAEELPATAAPWVRLGTVVVGAAAAIVFLRSVATLGLAMTDLGSSATRTGTVLRIRAFGSENRRRHYVAIDDGSSRRIRAFRVPMKLRWIPVAEGKPALATYSPRLRYLRDLRPAVQPVSEKVPSGS